METSCAATQSSSLSASPGGNQFSAVDYQLGANGTCTFEVYISGIPGQYTLPETTVSTSAGFSMSQSVGLSISDQLPSFSKYFSPASVPLAAETKSRLTFLIDNLNGIEDVAAINLRDTLPDGMVIASPSNLATTCQGVSPFVSATPGSNTFSYSTTASVQPPFLESGETCEIAIDVLVTSPGTYLNVSDDLLVTTLGGGVNNAVGMAVNILEVSITPVSLTVQFLDDPLAPGASGVVEYVIRNTTRNTAAIDVAFSSDLNVAPGIAGIVFDNVVSNTCGGIVSGAGSSTLSLSAVSVAATANCRITAQFTSPSNATPGSYSVATSPVSAQLDGSAVVGNIATDTLQVQYAPLFTKSLTQTQVIPGDSNSLVYKITNTDPNNPLTDISFTDAVGAFLPSITSNRVAPIPQSGDCGASSVIFFNEVSGVSNLNVSNASLASGESCEIVLNFNIPLSTPTGIYSNVSSVLTANPIGAPPAAVSMQILAAPRLQKAFTDETISAGESTTLEYTINHPGESGPDAEAITFEDDLNNLGITGLGITLPTGPACGEGSSLTHVNGVLTLTDGELTIGESCTFAVTLDVPPETSHGVYTNSTTNLSATLNGESVQSSPASATIAISPLVFSKIYLDDPVIAGGSSTLRFTVTNNDDVNAASNMSFGFALGNVIPGLTFTLPPQTNGCGGTLSGTTLLFFSGGTLAPDSSCNIEVTVSTPAATPNGSYLSQTSMLTATIDGSNVTALPARDLLLVDSTFIQLQKSFSNQTVQLDSPVQMQFMVSNLSTTQDVQSVAFSDDINTHLPGFTFEGVDAAMSTCEDAPYSFATSMNGVLEVSDGTLLANSSCTLTINLGVPPLVGTGNFTNTTSDVSGTVSGLAVNGEPASARITVTDYDVTFSKSFAEPFFISGGSGAMTFTITNNHATDPVNQLSFTDDLNDVLTGLVATNTPLIDVCGPGSSLTGTSFLAFSGGSVAANGGTCSFTVDFQLPLIESEVEIQNTTSPLTSNGLVIAQEATDDVTVTLVPSFNKTFSPEFVSVGIPSVLQFTIDNSGSTFSASSIDFTDNLPTGMVVAATPNVSTSCTGGTITALAGGAVVTYSGGTVSASSSCTVSVEVSAAVAGTYLNTSGDLTSSLGNSGTATATLTVRDIGFTKVFGSPAPQAGETTTLTFVIENRETVAISGLAFTDDLDAVVTGLAADGTAIVSNCGTPSVTAASNIAVRDASVAAQSTCTIEVTITVPVSTFPGSYRNTTSTLTASGDYAADAATKDLVVVPPSLLFSKAFTPSAINTDEVSTLVFTIDNGASPVAATSLAFTDVMPTGLVIATPANLINTCSGTVTATSGSSTISLTDGTVTDGAICTLQIAVTSSVGGNFVNTSGDLTSSSGNSGPANASLLVDDDTDNDGVLNAVDNCPRTPNANQADLDSDDIGNVCDDDDDGDGMPDAFENANGLDPFNSFDQQADNDNDGFTNLQEFQFGTDPNSPDADVDGNGVPDEVDQRRRNSIPSILFQLLLDNTPI
ncbi:hypothetical protein GCM10008090_33410 [Arenicella chitinivorans]|uniref:DUF7933 domain-containing protein n=2 Tax=Arenicella chitinivorans TaxID=1329800 RepID=A0A918VSJ3_9GAMM|nr:hypothetical protein GCM10008090_33410 [Arenicella chitinivorans]